MRKLNKMLLGARIRMQNAVTDFLTSERGDTNFISMLLIIGIVVVLAGLFLTLGKNVMSSVSEKVTNFVDGL